jgi:hypothetical protein
MYDGRQRRGPYLSQAWHMQDNAFLRSGSSLHEGNSGGA